MSGSKHIVVAGAGIVGASIAYHLAKRGARVTLVDAGEPGATANSFGWINSTFSKRPKTYFDLSFQAMMEWRRFASECGELLKVQFGGSVAWSATGPEGEDLAANVRAHQSWGYPVHVIDRAELGILLPSVQPGEFVTGCFCEPEAAVDPMAAIQALLESSRRFGVELRRTCRVAGLDLYQNRVSTIETGEGVIQADTFVLACGVDSPEVAGHARIRIPLKKSPGVLVHTTPQPRLLDRVILAPRVHCKQSFDGRIVAGGQVVAGVGTAITEADVRDADRILREVKRILPDLNNAAIEHVTLGYRVMPEDEYPIVGFVEACPNLYVAVMHSGVTLAPLIGRLAATEILDAVSIAALEPYRIERFEK